MDAAVAAPSRWRGALAGIVAGGVALAMGELVAGIGQSQRAPVIAVGDLVIDAVPRPVKDFAIDAFGTHDKVALLVGIYTVIGIIAAALGIAAVRRFSTGAIGIALFGLFGVFATLQDGDATFAEVLAGVLGAGAGIGVLWALLGSLPASSTTTPDALSRRSFLQLGAGAIVVGGVSASVGRLLQSRVSAAASRLAVVLPRPSKPAPAIPASTELGIDGLSTYVTPASDFYRIDVNLLVPQVAAEGWSVTIKGLVDHERSFTYDDVLAMPMVEEDVTLACVSNEVGGDLVGNARWLGTPLLPLLEKAGVQDGADQVVARSVDGFTVGMPTAALQDGRVALLAVGMNDEVLPIRHGFPARLVVAGLYGYVSATKWLSELELTTFDTYDPYWIQRGWAREAPIKTQSRIDTPRTSSKVSGTSAIAVAGVAWAQTRGIDRVELRVDDEDEWRACELADAVGKDTWRQWVYRWADATPGRHRLAVRATDGEGETQTEDRADPFPDGATGWHTIFVTVE
jgi:DMSO/TMAO reductase YedYZ molybdopterin-dependent catalytic subunit